MNVGLDTGGVAGIATPDTATGNQCIMSDRRSQYDRRTTGERRLDIRTNLSKSLRLLRSATPTTEVVEGEVANISAGGVGLLIKTPLEVKETILLEIREPGKILMNLAADVVWQETRENGWTMVGCELRTRLSLSQLASIRQFIQERALSGDLALA